MEWSLAHVPQHGYVVRMPTRLPPDLAEVFSDYAFVGEYCQSFLYAGEATRTLDERCGDLHAKIRDIETEELIEDQQQRIRELDQENKGLKEKLLVAKNQLVGTSRPASRRSPARRPLPPRAPSHMSQVG